MVARFHRTLSCIYQSVTRTNRWHKKRMHIKSMAVHQALKAKKLFNSKGSKTIQSWWSMGACDRKAQRIIQEETHRQLLTWRTKTWWSWRAILEAFAIQTLSGRLWTHRTVTVKPWQASRANSTFHYQTDWLSRKLQLIAKRLSTIMPEKEVNQGVDQALQVARQPLTSTKSSV